MRLGVREGTLDNSSSYTSHLPIRERIEEAFIPSHSSREDGSDDKLITHWLMGEPSSWRLARHTLISQVTLDSSGSG